MKQSLTLICCLACFGVFGQTLKEKTISIDPHLAFQNYEHFKRLTLSSFDSPIEFIGNFNFEWGYSYRITVIEQQLEEELSDGTKYEFALQEIVSKTKVEDSATFSLFIDPLRYYNEEEEENETLKQLNDSTYNYFDTVQLIIPHHLQPQMNKILKSRKGKRGVFQYKDAKRIRLIGFK